MHLRPRGLHRARRLERLPGLGGRHPADHRHAGPDGRRSRHLDGHHGRPDHHGPQQLLQRSGHGLRADVAAGVHHRARRLRPDRPADPAYGARDADRGGGHQPRGEPARRRPVPHDHLDRLRLLRVLCRHRGPRHRRQHQLGERQQPRSVDRARRHPRRRHRRDVAGRWPVLPHRHPRRRALHRDAGPHRQQHRDPVGAQLPLQGRRRDRRVPAPVAEGPLGLPGSTDRQPGGTGSPDSTDTRSRSRQAPRHDAPPPSPPTPSGTASGATARRRATCRCSRRWAC